MVGGHVVDSTEYTTYSHIIKYVFMILMLLIAVKNRLGIMAGDIGNLLFTSPCVEMFWSCCGVDFVPRCGAVVVLKRDLYRLNTALNSFHKYFGDFLRDPGFRPYREDQDLWIRKSDNDEGYHYIATHVGDVIISANNPSKYTHNIDMHFKARDINTSPKYYLGNELVRVGNTIHVSSNKCVNEIMRKY